MTTLTATAGTVNGLPAVNLVTDVVTDAATVTITREPAGPAGTTVRGADRHVDAGAVVAVTDLEAPLGATVTYTLTIRPDTDPSASTTTTAVVTVPDITAGAVILDPFTLQWVDVTVVDETRRDADTRTAVYWPAGSATPVVVHDTAQAWTVELDTITVTADQRDRLDTLLVAGDPFLVRYPAGIMLTGGWLQPAGTIGATRPIIDGTDPTRRYLIPTVTVAAPDPSVEATAVTLETMHTLEPTDLDALASHAPTLAALTSWAQDGALDTMAAP